MGEGVRGGRAGAWAWAWAILLLLPVASAGTENDPEIIDIADQGDKTLDLLSAWFDSASDGVLFTVKIAGADEPPPDQLYGVGFTFRGSTYVAVVAFDSRGDAYTDLRAPGFNRRGLDGPRELGNTLRDARFEAGSPAYVSARIPWEALPRLAPGSNLTDVFATVGDWSADEGWADRDLRQTEGVYRVESSSVPGVVKLYRTEATIGAAVIGALLVGAVVAAVLLWRRRARAPKPAPRSATTPPPSPPSSERFRLRPR